MSILKKVLLVIVVIVAVIVLVSFLLPGHVRVARSATVHAPADLVFAEVNDLKKWHGWAPWHKLDPDANYVYTGPEAGKGMKASWSSENKNVGNGSMEISESQPSQRIDLVLDFGDQGTAQSDFVFESDGEQTKVTWGFDTELGMNPMMRYMGLMFDSMIGKSYEEGLADLKEVCEKRVADSNSTKDNGQSTEPPSKGPDADKENPDA